ncbi:MAG: hypothetical protein D6765_13120, partial [Bacteroidetes bacterium]
MLWAGLLLSQLSLSAQPTFTLTPLPESGAPGETVQVEVSVDDFADIVSMQFSINWDPAVLQYQSLPFITTDLAGFNQSNFGTSANLVDNGKLTVSWLDPAVSGVTLPNGTLLFTIEFTVQSSDGTDIVISDDPSVIEVTDANGQDIGLNFVPGAFNGGSGSGGGGGGG